MKRTARNVTIALITVVVLSQSGVLTSIILFWLTGLIPGTNYSLSPLMTLLITIAPVTLYLVYNSNLRDRLKHGFASQLRPAASPQQQHLPKRRYTPITNN